MVKQIIKQMANKSSFWNVPNALSLLRLLLAPIILYFILQNQHLLATLIFLAALLTDLLDGYWARKYHQITPLGIHLDRWADKLLMGCTLLGILWQAQLWGWIWLLVVAVILFCIGYLFLGKKVQVNSLGRTVLWLEAILLLILLWNGATTWLVAIFFLLVLLPVGDHFRRILSSKKVTKKGKVYI